MSDGVTHTTPLLALVPDWQDFLMDGLEDELVNLLHCHERTGRPLGDQSFIKELEKQLNRRLLPQKPGPKLLRLSKDGEHN